jgi:hypothetical protein
MTDTQFLCLVGIIAVWGVMTQMAIASWGRKILAAVERS